MKTALICGVSGPDGALLARLLLQKQYRVFGTSRDAQGVYFQRLEKLGVRDQIELLSMHPEAFRSVFVSLNASAPE